MAAPAPFVQSSFDELDEPLRTTTFVVVDLETTGGAAASDAITEIGAVKVCGGQVLGEFQTLVHPGMSISPFVQVLTGITDSMVGNAPPVSSVLPAFLEFAAGSVLVAHNAPFDVGFLKAAAHALELPWPRFAVVDTAVLARRVLTKDEVPNCKLSSLAGFFRAATTPNHRALQDARATVDVLHGLIDRLGNLGVQSLPELRSFCALVPPAVRRKRHLAEAMPSGPGVYVFRDGEGRPLYVGTSRNLRSRVRQYFVASEPRTRMGEMVALAERVDPIPCAHALEAAVRELRLIGAHKPRYNRRSKFPERSVWLKLTDEVFPRLSIVRAPPGADVAHLGPLRTQRQAEAVRDAIHDAVPLRQCTDRLSLRRMVRRACALAGIGRCSAPCEGGATPQDYGALVSLVTAAWTGTSVRSSTRCAPSSPSCPPRTLRAGGCGPRPHRDGGAGVRAYAARPFAHLDRGTRGGAARRRGGWELSVVRRGRLAAAGTAARGVPPYAVVDALVATADAVEAEQPALAEEAEIILRWLEEPGTRLVRASSPWALPAYGAGGLVAWLATDRARRAATPFERRRSLPMLSRPARATA